MIFILALLSTFAFATEPKLSSALHELCAAVLASPLKAPVRREIFKVGTDEVLEIHAREAEPDLIVRTISRRTPTSREASAPRIDEANHFDRVVPLVDFASGKFTRRKWSSTFSAPEKMRATARAYLSSSTYFEVAQRSTGRTLGTLRVIKARPGESLPEAKYLNLVLEGNPQLEVGTFAIEETIESRLRAAVWYELWLELTTKVFGPNPSRAYRSTVIHTYGDEDSLGLYLPLGFEFLHAKFTDQGARPPPILKDGSNWWPLTWTPFEVSHINHAIWRGERPTLRRATPKARCEAKADANAFFNLDVESLLQSLAGPVDQRASLAEEALNERLRALNEYHRELACASPSNRRRAERAIDDAETDLEKLEVGFRDVLNSERASSRYRVAALLDEALWQRAPRRALSDQIIVDEFIPKLLMDEDLFVVMQAAHALRNLSLARYRQMYSSRASAAADARARLTAAHLPEPLIAEASRVLNRMWSTPLHKPLTSDGHVSYHDNSATDAVAVFFFKLPMKRADIVRDLITSVLEQ